MPKPLDLKVSVGELMTVSDFAQMIQSIQEEQKKGASYNDACKKHFPGAESVTLKQAADKIAKIVNRPNREAP